MKTYSSILSELNRELSEPEVQLILRTDGDSLSSLRKLQSYLLRRSYHNSSSPSQEILCSEMLSSIRRKKQSLKIKTGKVLNDISRLDENDYFPGFKEYMNCIALIAPDEAKMLLRLIK